MSAVSTLIVPIHPANDPVPPGFSAMALGNGFSLYRRDRAGEACDFVSVTDLRFGTVRTFTGAFTRPWDGAIHRKTLAAFWASAQMGNTSTRVLRMVISGTAFDALKNPTRVAFGVRSSGTTIHCGHALGPHPGGVLTVHCDMRSEQVDIRPHVPFHFSDPGAARDIFGGLSPSARQDAYSQGPWTLVGVRDTEQEGTLQTLLTFSSASTRLVDAVEALEGFGASAIAMLDAGEGTGLISDREAYIQEPGPMPHAIALYAGH